ncbi:MAG: metal-dependent hydrolase [Bacteroidota bacterium]|nr:metal-dependent hydrolase [Bacteroidota bacterium]
MDSLTHIAIGACIGEAFSGRIEGKKVMLWGILAQSIPDIDFLAAFWLDTSDNLLAHRGFTHSILFGVIMTPILAAIADRLHRPHQITYKSWVYFFATAIMTHIFLDVFNNYGVGWFEPFNDTRISFNIMYVADPFFTIGPGLACVILFLLKQKSIYRKFWWKFGFCTCILYLGYSAINKAYINHEVKQLLVKQEINYTRYFTTPAPLQNWLWYVVAGNDSGYYVGYRSVFDRSNKIDLEYFPRNSQLINTIQDRKDVQQLIRFSQQFYTIEKNQDTLLFNDLRFGQVIGWQDPKEKFAFHYYLQPDLDNTLVVQRGRFAKWDNQSMRSLLTRIKGN